MFSICSKIVLLFLSFIDRVGRRPLPFCEDYIYIYIYSCERLVAAKGAGLLESAAEVSPKKKLLDGMSDYQFIYKLVISADQLLFIRSHPSKSF